MRWRPWSPGSTTSTAGWTCWSTTSGAASCWSGGACRSGSTTSPTGCGCSGWPSTPTWSPRTTRSPLLARHPGGLVVEVTDGTAAYNEEQYRINVYYDLAKIAPIRLARSWAHELRAHGGTALAVTPGWLRSELMLELFGVTEATWHDALARQPHFAISETPRFVGRGVAAVAADPERHRWNARSTSSGELAREYGLTDLDGSRPDCWRYVVEVQDAGLPADVTGYR
jgi:hypothetical protein